MFKLPEEVKKGIEDYKNSLKELLEGKTSPARFRGIRVPWGFYSHRGGKVFMSRIRVAAGVVSSSQLKALAVASRKYGSGILHITTRQDIQIHDVKIENTIKIMEYLKDYELSPRGGGGNTVRNVIACPLSDICKEQIFDVRGYAVAVSEYLLRQDSSFNLPRKFKISFSGCSKDCAGCQVNDIGFFAQLKNGKKGFKVFVGGGMGLDSRLGKLLEDFIPEDELGYCVAAVKNVYYKTGDRKNRHHNRLRFLIDDDIGLEEFKKRYKEELQELKGKEHIALRKADFAKKESNEGKIPEAEDKQYNEFLKYNVQPQKQNGFSIVELRIPRGDISHEKLAALAELEKDFPGIEFRTSQNQNLFVCWVRNQDAHKLFLKLKTILDDFLYPQTLLDVVVCKGALTCNLGLCNSPGLSKEIEAVAKRFIGKKAFNKLEIKLNGCPNSCGQHPIGKISFHGLVRRVDGRAVPFYNFLFGGRKELGKAKLAEAIGMIPAKNIPVFLNDFLSKAEKIIKDNEDIYGFLDEKGKELALELINKYSYVPPYSENGDFYIDWGKTEEFSLAGLGPGECSAGVIDMIEADLAEAKIALEEAEKSGYSAEKIKKAIFSSARALLVVKGSDPKSAENAFSDFKAKFIDEGVASGNYSDIKDVFNSINEKLPPEKRKEKLGYAGGFLEHVDGIYKSMDPSFNFPQIGEKAKTEEAVKSIDLKGTPCPLNYVKAKLVLENLNSGDILEILLDEGEPIENVPRSLENDGHKILKIERLDGFYKVVVKKK